MMEIFLNFQKPYSIFRVPGALLKKTYSSTQYLFLQFEEKFLLYKVLPMFLYKKEVIKCTRP